MIQPLETEFISRTLQQGLADWNPNPLVPKAFQQPVQSDALNAAIAAIVTFARAPLEDAIRRQQEQILHLQAQMLRLEQALKG